MPYSDFSSIASVGFQLEEFLDCTYLPLARVVEDPDIIREEEGHVDFGTNAAAEFAAKGGEYKERVQRAVDYWYVKGLDMFGNSQVVPFRALHVLGLQAPAQRGGAPAVQRRDRRADFENGSHAPRSQQGPALYIREREKSYGTSS